MPKIYLYCVHGGFRPIDVIGYALAEDGTGLGSHLSSDGDYSMHDMGLTSSWKHDTYSEHYPEGYELEWIDECNLDNHSGWVKAFNINQKRYVPTAWI